MGNLKAEEKEKVQAAVVLAKVELDDSSFTGKKLIGSWSQPFCKFTMEDYPRNDCLMCPVERIMGIHCSLITCEANKTRSKQPVLDALTQIEAAAN
jgi:hypothetical protein